MKRESGAQGAWRAARRAILQGYEASTWYGFMVPTGTPREAVARLHEESVKQVKLPEIRERLDAAGFEVVGTSPEQFTSFVRSEIEKWGKVVKTAGLRID